MNRLCYIILVVGLSFAGCHDVTVGFLTADHASYSVDSLHVCRDVALEDWMSELEEQEEYTLLEDAMSHFKKKFPWTSPLIEGIRGTAPLVYTIADIQATKDGNVEVLRKELIIKGGGRLELPYDFKASPGCYHISIMIANEGYSQTVKDVLVLVIH